MRIDLHTHVVPPRWEDFASRYGGGKWPRLEAKDACHATIMTGDQFFRDIDDRSWSPARRIEDMDRLGIDRQALSPPPIMFCYWAEPKRGPGLRAHAERERGRHRRAASRAVQRHGGGASSRSGHGHRGAALLPRGARPRRRRDRHLSGRARLRRPRAFPVLRGVPRAGHGGVRAPGDTAGRPGAAHEVLLPADRRESAGDGAGGLQADLRRRARAAAGPAHLPSRTAAAPSRSRWPV